MDTFGTITFQANDKSDIFFKTLLQSNDIEESDESFIDVEDAQFEGHFNWVTGKVPSFHPVMVTGDTSIIHAWFQAKEYQNSFTITIYIECEMAEELVEVEADEGVIDADNKSDLEPIEINL